MTQGTRRLASHARGGARAAGIVLFLACVVGCGPGDQAIDVTVSGLTAVDADHLEADVLVPASETTRVEVRSPLDRFILRVSSASRGLLKVRVAAQRGDGCRVALGSGQIMLRSELTSERYALPVTVAPVGDGCAVQIDHHGDGAGQVLVSESVGEVPCAEAECSAALQRSRGASVTLRAIPDADSYFAGWSGPCSGQDLCSSTVRHH